MCKLFKKWSFAACGINFFYYFFPLPYEHFLLLLKKICFTECFFALLSIKCWMFYVNVVSGDSKNVLCRMFSIKHSTFFSAMLCCLFSYKQQQKFIFFSSFESFILFFCLFHFLMQFNESFDKLTFFQLDWICL